MNLLDRSHILLLGPTGQIGSALLRALPATVVHPISWSALSGLSDEKQIQWIEDFISKKIPPGKMIQFVFANGVTNPALGEPVVFSANYELPRKFIRHWIEKPQTRFLTLGTIMEFFPEACANNPYLKSKWRLGQEALEFSSRWPNQWLHLRLHTVYGSSFKPHMFLGQIAEALKNNRVFQMSSGKQLREYHHADSVAQSIDTLLSTDWGNLRATLELNSGRPVTLAELATAVFHFFEKTELLHIGKISAQQGDNTQMSFPRSEPWLIGQDREPLSGVISELQRYLGNSES